MKTVFRWIVRQVFGFKRPFRLTRGGWVFVLYTIGIGAGAINTGNNLLYLIFGLFIGIIIASGLLSDLTLWGLSVDVHFPSSLEARQTGLVGIKLTNHKKFLPSLSLTIEMEGVLRGETLLCKKYIPVVRAKEILRSHLAVKPEQRGFFEMRQLRCTTRFPFGLIHKWWRSQEKRGASTFHRGSGEEGALVFPASVPIGWDETMLRTAGEDLSTVSGRRGEGSVVVGLRDYQEGDNPRRVHWKASAKRGEGLYMREMEEDEQQEKKVLWWGLLEMANFPEETVEEMIRFTASVVRRCQEEGAPLTLFFPKNQWASPGSYFRLKGRRPHDPFLSSLEFLSLFDSRDPFASGSQDYLEAVPGPHLNLRFIPMASLYEKTRF